MEDHFGHGLLHATKVALDAGCLLMAEGERIGYSPGLIKRLMVVVQVSALLHDLERKEPDDTVRGATFAAVLLGGYPFSIEEREDVRLAILDHEAFKKRVPINSRRGALVSDCLYDADKFRWGPDGFTDTLWHMVSSKIRLSTISWRVFPEACRVFPEFGKPFVRQPADSTDRGLSISVLPWEKNCSR